MVRHWETMPHRCRACGRDEVTLRRLPRCMCDALIDVFHACRTSPRTAYSVLHSEDRVYYLISLVILFLLACRILKRLG